MLGVLITVLAVAVAFTAYELQRDRKFDKMLKERERETEKAKQELLDLLDRLEEKHWREQDGTI